MRGNMFRLWTKVWKENRLLKEVCLEDGGEDTRTHKIFRALEEACVRLDLSSPIWLDKNIAELKRYSKTRFSSDNFIEAIDFDYLEIHIIEED